jgi:energy-converting hydrogenase Eha subunit E
MERTRIRLSMVLFVALVVLLTPVEARAQEEDPCAQYEVGSPEWHQCIDEMVLANRQAGQRMILIAGTAALVVAGVVITVSMSLSRRRMVNVDAGEMRDLLRDLVPPEAGHVSDQALERAVRSARSVPPGYELLVITVFVGVAVVFLLFQLSGSGLLTMVALAAFLGFIFLMAILTPLRIRRAQRSADEWLAPLGLSMLALPQVSIVPRGGGLATRVTGPSVIGGTRHGREVQIAFGMGTLGAQTVRTHVATPVQEPFEVSGDDADWQSRPLPSGVLAALQKFGPLDQRVRVQGGPDGITVERQRRATEAASARGTVQWLTDLRLAESLADALR